MPLMITYPFVLLAHECGDTDEHANLDAALLAADEHCGVPVDEFASARTLLEPLSMVWRKVAERRLDASGACAGPQGS